mmetsp:Transcript_4985/g.8640  ORF Transcript_4985/g.8640 Transcript_4985/m.8640 type:complete len:236 (+) Transcript_4985:154-861(+)
MRECFGTVKKKKLLLDDATIRFCWLQWRIFIRSNIVALNVTTIRCVELASTSSTAQDVNQHVQGREESEIAGKHYNNSLAWTLGPIQNTVNGVVVISIGSVGVQNRITDIQLGMDKAPKHVCGVEANQGKDGFEADRDVVHDETIKERSQTKESMIEDVKVRYRIAWFVHEGPVKNGGCQISRGSTRKEQPCCFDDPVNLLAWCYQLDNARSIGENYVECGKSDGTVGVVSVVEP